MAYTALNISAEKAEEVSRKLFKIKGVAKPLPGDLDFNFKIKSSSGSYILKISRPGTNQDEIDFQQQVLIHISKSDALTISPEIIRDIKGNLTSFMKDESGNSRMVRMLSWIDGRLWSSVNPINNNLLFSLGEQAGKITRAFKGFDHPLAHRKFEWDISQAAWTFNHLNIFDKKQKENISFFQERFKIISPYLAKLRKGIVHNDVNDNNIVVSEDLLNPKVKSIIDYGDTIHTAIINDLAIVVAYAIMNKPDPLQAALPIIKGYHSSYPLEDAELKLLYVLIAMRLVISVTKSAVRKQEEPENKYTVISEKPAWELLEKWIGINEDLAYYYFRGSCGFTAHPDDQKFKKWAQSNPFNLGDFFPTLTFKSIYNIDLSTGSTWLGSKTEIQDPDLNLYKMRRLQSENQNKLICGGYNETRSLYSTTAFKKIGNSGPEYRTVHLGIDFWIEEGTAIHSLFDGTVFSMVDNDINKDYGPTLILEHQITENFKFYTLYGHLSKSTLRLLKKGQSIYKGEPIAYIGKFSENGHWTPHLHFQVILGMHGKASNFPGVTFPNDVKIWQSICPDPNLLFKEPALYNKSGNSGQEISNYRKEHLGKGLSLSYAEPLKILRGDGVYLIDHSGRKYLDTVNNVAHVGHEHPRVVKAGKDQMSVLNTNTRYLHENINNFAKELLSSLPKELSVVHFVNSGSEANELAMRMAKTYSGQKDFIALEFGYHGNTSACIDVSSYKFDSKGGTGAPEHTHIVPLPDSFRGKYQGENTAKKYASHIQQQIDTLKSKGRGVAGFIFESIIGCGGQIELPAGYLTESCAMVHKAGGLCIADEVQIGCGRMGSTFWGFQLHNVIPDIVTIGKPIGNGHPLAAVVCTQKVADSFANGMEYFNTFGGNPVSCAIGLEVLKVIKDEKLQQNALQVGEYLKLELRKLQKDFPVFADIRGQGLFLGIELVDKDKNPLADKTSYLVNRMKEFAILMSIDGPDHNVLKIKPPIVFSKENADEFLERLSLILKEDYMMGI